MEEKEQEKERRLTFPRTKIPPIQSSKYWAKEKDRYIRQLLLADLKDLTKREAIVYFADLSQGINHTDSDDLSEIIDGLKGKDIDLIIQTPGGQVDAVEKIITLLNCRLDSYRVIVPSIAKSGGTAIAVSSDEILLGVNSELGPIDPQFTIQGIGNVPCEYIADDENQDGLVRKLARTAVDRMKALTEKILEKGMLKDSDASTREDVVKKLSSSDSYKSHGAVIDYSEAKAIGLNVTWLDSDDPVWKIVWLLHCCYDYDAKLKNIGKIIEGEKNSIARKLN